MPARRHRAGGAIACHDDVMSQPGRYGPGQFDEGHGFPVRPGALLIAAPDLIDLPFRRTVVLVLEDTEAGSVGLVLNHPSESPVQNVLGALQESNSSNAVAWAELAAKPKVVFVGGPVNRGVALCVGVLKPGASAAGLPGLKEIAGRLVLVDIDRDPEPYADLLENVRLFAGYAGWGMGQLRDELDREDWMVCESHHSDVLAPSRVDLWGRVVRRQGGRTALLATHPIDVNRN